MVCGARISIKIAITGTGYVGFSNATPLSQNHKIIALDIIPEKIEQLNNKISPIADAEIEDFLANKHLNFTATLNKELTYKDADFINFSQGCLGKTNHWGGGGIDEKGYDAETGNLIAAVDKRYFRPTEVETLLGNPSKAKDYA